MGRRKFTVIAVAVAAALGTLQTACSSDGGSGCKAGAVECRGTDSQARCAADGSGWSVAACDLGDACTVSACAPIACPGTPCPEPLVCKDGGCAARACTAGQRRCTAYSTQFEECDATGTGFGPPQACPADQACADDECRAVVCKAREVGCGDDGTGIRTCLDSGTGWTTTACFGTNVCEDGSCKAFVCQPDSERCRPDFATIQRCNEHGTGWADREACPEVHACEDLTCKPLLCKPLAWTCADDFRTHWQCNASGTATLPPEACDDLAACRSGECRPVICTPGTSTCTQDAIGLLTCDGTGTRADLRSDCNPDQACVNGACVPALSPLGEVVKIRRDQGAVALSPGVYAVAVSDAALNDDTIPFPLTLSGNVMDPPTVFQAIAMTPTPRRSQPWTCGTPAMIRNMPRPRAVPHLAAAPMPRVAVAGDTRTFRVIADDGYTLVPRTAVLRLVGNLANIWEDVTTGPSGGTLTQATLQRIGDRLDGGVFARDVALYGQPTDVDGNGKIDVLFTNMLPSGNAAAYVWPVTLYPQGSLPYTVDHGEVVYSMRPDGFYSEADIAGIIAHETAHLLVAGRRLQPWLSHLQDMPEWVATGDAYLGEGLAEVAEAWSGQVLLDTAYTALQNTDAWRLGALFLDDYYLDGTLGYVHYGVAAVTLGYLFLQAGGVDVTGAATLADRGGVAYLAAASDRQSGFARIAAMDGRNEVEWYSDMAAALLLTTVPGIPGTAADPRYRFPGATRDPWFNGYNGLPIRLQDAAVLKRVPFTHVGGQMPAGGVRFFTVLVSGSTTATVIRDTSAAVFVRYRP